jgi:hypothetical protein
MLVKCYEYLHPFVRSFFDQDVFHHDFNLDILEQIANTTNNGTYEHGVADF